LYFSACTRDARNIHGHRSSETEPIHTHHHLFVAALARNDQDGVAVGKYEVGPYSSAVQHFLHHLYLVEPALPQKERFFFHRQGLLVIGGITLFKSHAHLFHLSCLLVHRRPDIEDTLIEIAVPLMVYEIFLIINKLFRMNLWNRPDNEFSF